MPAQVVAKVIGADPYSDVAVLQVGLGESIRVDLEMCQVDLPEKRKQMLRPLARGRA